MKKLFCLVVASILFILSITAANATISMYSPEIVINQETGECAGVWSQSNTLLPQGWVLYELRYDYIGNVENIENYVRFFSTPSGICFFESYDLENCCEQLGYKVVPDPRIDIRILIGILTLAMPILLFSLLLTLEFRRNVVKNKQLRGTSSWTGIKSVLIGPLLIIYFLLDSTNGLYLYGWEFIIISGYLWFIAVIPNFLCFLIVRRKARRNNYFKIASVLGISIVLPYLIYTFLIHRTFFEYNPLILWLVFYHIFMNLSILYMRIKKG